MLIRPILFAALCVMAVAAPGFAQQTGGIVNIIDDEAAADLGVGQPVAVPAVQAGAPKLGPDALPVTQDNRYLRAGAPDYWAFAPFVKPQFTSSACSVAAVTGALNGLRGLPAGAEDEVMSQEAMLGLVGSDEWAGLSTEGGDGVTFAQLEEFTRLALEKTGMAGYVVTPLPVSDTTAGTSQSVREILTRNETSAKDAVLVYYNQGVVTGDWDGPHVAVIGAYDAAEDRVLILEVDQLWYIPYWTSVDVLIRAMAKPITGEHGPLAGGTGGLLRIGPGA